MSTEAARSSNHLLQSVLVLHLLGVIAQAALAGHFLSGVDSAVPIHEVTGWAVAALGLVQIVIAVMGKKIPLSFTIASIGTAIIIFGLVVWQTLWAFGERRV
jgi:hypothetical protein